jgi:hypothetical protein
MKDWMLMLASATAASLIAFSELSPMNTEFPATGGSTATVAETPVSVRDPGVAAGNGANDQAIGAAGQAGLPRDR